MILLFEQAQTGKLNFFYFAGFLQRKEAYTNLNLEAPLVYEDWLKISIPMKNEELHAFHELDEVKKKRENQSGRQFI